PLWKFFRRYTKKKIQVDENMNEEAMSELYDYSKHGIPHISYQSVSIKNM
ncbi:hypothetical protein POVCU1_055370, partial [Plasmodium ovale curtisi]